MGLVELERARRAVGFVFFASGTLYATWVSRLPAVRDALRVDERTLGLVLLASAGGAIVAFRFAGALVGAWGSKAVTRASGVVFCASVPFVGLARNALVLAAVLAVAGASSGLMDVAMNANGVEVEKRIGRPILSALHGLFSLGGLAGAMAGAAAAHAELPLVLHFGVVAAALVVGIVTVTRWFVPDGADGREADAVSARGRVSSLSPRLLGLGVIAFCSSVGEGAMADWSALYLRDLLGTTASLAALGYAIFSLAMLTGRFTGDRVTSRLGDARVVRGAAALVAVGLAAALLVNRVPAMMLGFGAAGAGLSVIVPIVFRAGATVKGISPSAALATVATLSYGGFMVGPPVIGFVAAKVTLRGGLVVVVVLAAIAAVLAGLVRDRAATSSRRAASGA